MKSFQEVAQDHKFSPVRALHKDLNNYLHLDKQETKVVLNSKEFHHFEGNENGWFDLELEDHRGFNILLHNALTQSQTMPGVSNGKRAG